LEAISRRIVENPINYSV